MKLKIKITKDVLKRSMYCGTDGDESKIESNCAVALAVRDIFPTAEVGHFFITIRRFEGRINIPHCQYGFINKFDYLRNIPEERLNLTPFDFTVEVPDELISLINIDDIIKSETLELVSDL